MFENCLAGDIGQPPLKRALRHLALGPQTEKSWEAKAVVSCPIIAEQITHDDE